MPNINSVLVQCDKLKRVGGGGSTVRQLLVPVSQRVGYLTNYGKLVMGRRGEGYCGVVACSCQPRMNI